MADQVAHERPDQVAQKLADKAAQELSDEVAQKLADEVAQELADELDDEDTAEFDNLASELLKEEDTAVNGTSAGTKPAPTPGLNPGVLPARAAAHSSAAAALSSLNSLMSRARAGGLGGLRFGSGAATAQTDPFIEVLGPREGARWREVLARDAARPPVGPRALSRAYRCDRSRVRALDLPAATALAADAVREAAVAIKAPPAELAKLSAFADRMGPAFLPEVERAIAARLASDPDYDPARFPFAAARFAL